MYELSAKIYNCLTEIIKFLVAFSPKRKVHTSRLSMMPPSLNASTLNLRKAEMENNPSLELELAYSEYVSSYAELLLEKKNLKDTEVSFTKSINSLQEEVWSLQEKCKLIETRISDIKALSCINDYADIVQINIKHFIGELLINQWELLPMST